jgi:hypothetical protein
MWKSATMILVAAAVLSVVLMEVLRSVVHARRKSKDGLGGTQDIAMWGTLIGYLLLLGAGICGLVWLFTR